MFESFRRSALACGLKYLSIKSLDIQSGRPSLAPTFTQTSIPGDWEAIRIRLRRGPRRLNFYAASNSVFLPTPVPTASASTTADTAPPSRARRRYASRYPRRGEGNLHTSRLTRTSRTAVLSSSIHLHLDRCLPRSPDLPRCPTLRDLHPYGVLHPRYYWTSKQQRRAKMKLRERLNRRNRRFYGCRRD